MYNFEKLEVWQKARQFVNLIYKITDNYPSDSKFGLAQHTRKSAVSILSNISEAGSRKSKPEGKRFIEIALGSLYETISQLLVALDNKYIGKTEFDSIYSKSESIAMMLSKLSSSLKG